MHKRTCIIICGPTATGKTRLAATLAQKLGGCIINADSMQVYDHVRVLTARPSKEELASFNFPYYLDGVLSENARGSTGWWTKEAAHIMERAFASGQVPIVVGGTGLYLKSLMDGISAIPDVPRAIQQQIRQLALQFSLEELQEKLDSTLKEQGYTPTKKYQDNQRLLRALEVLVFTGKPIDHFYNSKKHYVQCDYIVAFLLPERQPLYKKIDMRFDIMMEQGAVSQVEDLLKLPLDPDHPILKATGVPALKSYLNGTVGLNDAVEKAKQDTRNFAKRQITWFKGQITPTVQFDPYDLSPDEQVSSILAKID